MNSDTTAVTPSTAREPSQITGPTDVDTPTEAATAVPSHEPTDPGDSTSTEDPESVASDELSSVADDDSDAVAALEDRWTAQLASSPPHGPFVDFLARYQQLKSLFPNVVLARSGDWPGSFGPSSRSSWVVLSGDAYDTTQPLLDWCAENGLSEDGCWGKRLETNGEDPLINTDRAPADDRNN